MFWSMTEFRITAENAADGLVRIAAYDLNNARKDAIYVIASAVAELAAIAQRRAETDARIKARMRELTDRRDSLANILDAEPSFDFPNDAARKNAAAAMEGETASLRGLGEAHSAWLAELLAAEREQAK